MTKLPLVSIDCLVYNHEPFLRQCFDGFIMQETNFKFEIIVHDDASTDKSANIIKEYTNKYPNLFYPIYQSENQYSRGIDIEKTIIFPKCRGKYIALCEGDDYWTDPYKLQKQVDFLEANNDYAGCAHQTKIIYNDNKSSHIYRKNVNSEIKLSDIIENRKFHTASLVFKKNVILNNEKWPKVTSGDRLLIFLVIFYGKIKYFDESMCVYRKHATGMSSSITFEKMKLDLNMVSFLKRKNIKFPKYRFLSFTYLSIAKYSYDIKILQKIYYIILSIIFSFSTFPNNLIFYLSILHRKIKKFIIFFKKSSNLKK